MTRYFYILAFYLLAISTFSQTTGGMSLEEYINTYKDLAIREMNEYGVPASITLAQGILESNCGASELAVNANNHFGIKCRNEWKGKTYYMDDDEKDECFRKYKDPEESYHDHSLFLRHRERYSFLFRLDIMDYKGWAYGLKDAGYATNPRYPEMLVKIIEENGLNRFDSYNNLAIHGEKVKSRNAEVKINGSLETGAVLALTDLETLGNAGNSRSVYRNNGIKFILARQGDTFSGIAAEFTIYTWKVYSYNDLKKKDRLKDGQIIYLEHKKRKAAKEHKYHTVQDGETMYDISQIYGMRLKALCKLNNVPPGRELVRGQRLVLR
jgi:LysM repeat protein